MRLAIQEDMLTGRTLLQKFENARDLGLQGIEFWADDLTARVPEIVAAAEATGVQVAAVNFGRGGTLLTPDPQERQQVLSAMRQAMANAIDLGARQMVFVPHYGPPLLPDLHPYKAPVQLEAEMLVAYLRQIFTDLAYAMGMTLYMLPVNRFETHFINQLDQAASIRRKFKDHAHVQLAASVFHMLLEERDVVQALHTHGANIGYMHIADHNRRLPGQGIADFAGVASALKAVNYTGWLTLECGEPGNNAYDAYHLMADLPASLAYLRQAGF